MHICCDHPKDPMKKHDEIFRYIVDYKTCSDGNSPSIRKIGQACKMSTSMVVYYLDKLVDLELISIEEGKIHVRGGAWRYIPERLDTHVNWSIINNSFTNEAVPPSVDST